MLGREIPLEQRHLVLNPRRSRLKPGPSSPYCMACDVMGTLEAEERSASRPLHPHPAPFKAVQAWPRAPYLPSMTVMTSFIWMCSLSGSSKS